MQQIKCPKCGEIFQIDESSYLEIVNQVKNKEFTKEVNEKINDVKATLIAEKNEALEKANGEIKQLKAEKKALIDNQESKTTAEVAKANETNSKTIGDLKSEIERLKVEKKALDENQKAKTDAEVAKASEASGKIISELKSQIETLKLEKINLENSKTQEIELTKTKIELENKDKLAAKDNEISNLKSSYDTAIRIKDDEIARYKENKAKLSVKLLGENLEQHCMNAFNQIRSIAFPNAYFEKDNEVSKESGSKGDFIFKDYATLEDKEKDTPYISIMFEMKNESDVSKTKHKNEDFLKELDKDRNEKHCEYAVLVSMLEPNNDLYNNGIVDVSYKFPKGKMFVIRPQFFIPIISFLVNAAKNSITWQRQLAEAKMQNADINNFQQRMFDWQNKFDRHFKLATDRYEDAIKNLENIRDWADKAISNLKVSYKHLSNANSDAKDLSIKKLVKDNPTMKQKFIEAGIDIDAKPNYEITQKSDNKGE